MKFTALTAAAVALTLTTAATARDFPRSTSTYFQSGPNDPRQLRGVDCRKRAADGYCRATLEGYGAAQMFASECRRLDSSVDRWHALRCGQR